MQHEENGLQHISGYRRNPYIDRIEQQMVAKNRDDEIKLLARMVVRLERRQDAQVRMMKREEARKLARQSRTARYVASHCDIINKTTKLLSEADELLSATENRFRGPL